MAPEPLRTWPDPLVELLGFLATFLAAGAIGFRYFALRGLALTGGAPAQLAPEGAKLGFAAASARRAALWGLAARRGGCDRLTAAGGLWIGTLFLLVVAALVPLRRATIGPERRGALSAALVRAFSPWALASAALLATFGVITAWRHLKRLDALWTTPYGYVLITKLCVVAVVVGLGAWNWRRQLPHLGSEVAAIELERTARVELAAALVVLLVTAVLVSLPSPR